ncbi:MAG: substrate-binding domain-containing protein [Actinomycetales bacterium]|nr:substrate-binding domain-containing protein [Actinomycetales bacterium]
MTSLTKKVLAAAAGAVVIAGLATAPAAQAAPKSGLKIAVIPKAVNIGYFKGWNDGAQKACKELKAAKCDYIGPTQATGPAQLKFINQAIQQKYNAIVLSAADQNALAPALKKAKAAGICVVTSDADVADTTTRAASVLPASAQRIGEAEVDWIAQEIGGKGKVAILSAAATAANQNAWIDFMKAYLPKKYPNIQLVGVYYGDDDATKSAQQYNQILTEHPDIAGIISPTTVGIRAAAQEKKSKGGTVAITGLGLPSEMKDYVLGGQVTKFGLWNPIDLGYVGTYAAAECASSGNKVPKSFKAGSKTYTQGANGVIFLGDPATFDKSNITKFAAIY